MKIEKLLFSCLLVVFTQICLAQSSQITVQFPDKLSISENTYYDTKTNKLYSLVVDYYSTNLVVWDLWNSVPERTIEVPGFSKTDGRIIILKDSIKNLIKIYNSTNKEENLLEEYLYDIDNHTLSKSESKLLSHLLIDDKLTFVSPNNSIDGSLGYQDVTGISIQEKLKFIRTNKVYNLTFQNANYYNMVNEKSDNYGRYNVKDFKRYEKVTLIEINEKSTYWKNISKFELPHNTIAISMLPDGKKIALLDADYQTIRLFSIKDDFSFEFIKELKTSTPSTETFGFNIVNNGNYLVISNMHSIEIIDINSNTSIVRHFHTVVSQFNKSQIIVQNDSINTKNYKSISTRDFDDEKIEVLMFDYGNENFSTLCRIGTPISFIINLKSGEFLQSSKSAFQIPTDLSNMILSIPCDKSFISLYDCKLKKEIKHIPLDKSLEEFRPLLSENSFDNFSMLNYGSKVPIYKWFPYISKTETLDDVYLDNILTETTINKDKSMFYKDLVVDPGSIVYQYTLKLINKKERKGKISTDRDYLPQFYDKKLTETHSFTSASDNEIYFLNNPNNLDIDSVQKRKVKIESKTILFKLNDTGYLATNVYEKFPSGKFLIERDLLILGNAKEISIRNFLNNEVIYEYSAKDSIISFHEWRDGIITKKISYLTKKGDLFSIDLQSNIETKIVSLPTLDKDYKYFWSKNGQYIMFRNLDSVIVYDIYKNKLHTSFKVSKEYSNIAFSIENRHSKEYSKGLHLSNSGNPIYYLPKGTLENNSAQSKIISFNYLENDSTAFELMLSGKYWLTILPNGFYYGEPEAVEGITFFKDNRAYPYTQFDHYYNRPHEVMQVISAYFGEENDEGIRILEKAYEKRLKKTGLNPSNKLENNIPTLKIINKNELPKTEKKIQLNVEMTAITSEIKDLFLEVNDVPVSHQKINGNTNAKINLTVDLMDGFNLVKVYCRDANGNKSLPEYIPIYGEYENIKPNLYLVSIGASEYQNAKFNLTYAAKDANDFVEQMKKSTVYGEVCTKTLTNQDVNTASLKSIKEFLSNATILDEVVIFVAGHGVLDQELDYYLATYNMDFNNPKQCGLAYDELEALFKNIKPLKKVLILDACHSGEIDKEDMEHIASANHEEGEVQFRSVGNNVKNKIGIESSSELSKSIFTDLRTGTGATVISASGGMEFAMESKDLKNGLFTFCFLNGIKTMNADLNKDGEIWLKEIQEYVQTEVYQKSGGRQRPTSRIENNTLDYRIW